MTSVDFDFTGTRVLVTGGSNGIGFGIASAFLAAGAHVTITGTRAAAIDYDNDLSAFAYHQCSLGEPNATQRLADGIAAAHTTLDVLVNNAGQNFPGGRSEYDAEAFEASLAINLVAPFRLAQACLPMLQASTVDGGSSVINMGSMTSYFGMEIVPGYGAAKGGIVQVTKTLAIAWAKHGIRVNAIAPGLIETNMTRPMLEWAPLMDPLLERTPMKRTGDPSDIAPVALFLASPGAKFITGQTIPVDGGFSIQG